MRSVRLTSERLSRLALLAIGLVAIAYVVSHIALIYSDRVNWDEFLLLQRAEVAHKLGRIDGGGRPGLGVVALVPFVSSCSNPIDAVDTARLIWGFMTFTLLAGLFTLLRQAVRPSTHATHAAALGTACLALVPVFMRWSLQVRTDQPAIMCALWGGVALLAARRQPRWALLAGLLFGTGYLFSQKAIYVAGLCSLLGLATLYGDNAPNLRRAARCTALALAGGAIALVGYKLIVPLFYVPATAISFESGMNAFEYYRKLIGYRVYRSMVPTLYPQLFLGAALLLATFLAYRRQSEHRRSLLMAFALATSGVVIGQFHAAAFPYFWMTLGLFVSVPIAFGWPGVVAMLGRGSVVVAIVAWAWLAYIAIPYTREILAETQLPQRESFAFVERNLPPTAFGFHADGGMFCRRDPRPFPGYIRQNILAEFTGPGSEPRVDTFIGEFRARPVSFLLTNALELFPPKIQTFWASHYVPYFASVAIAGFKIKPGDQRLADVIVPGTYRWLGDQELVVGTTRLQPQATIELARGEIRIENKGQRGGMLVLAVADPPRAARAPFHSSGQLAELLGYRRW